MRTLVDTSVWIDFFRGSGSSRLAALLDTDDALVHPWVRGELALGRLGAKRAAILGDLTLRAAAPLLDDEEILHLIDVRSLAGSGIGWVDAHLCGSALVAGAALWTLDRRLARAAAALGLPSR